MVVEAKNKVVAIQGIKGSFHHQAAELFFPDHFQVFECDWFNHVFDAVNDRKADFGIVAIENTVAGSLLENYRLLLQSKRKIVGEILMRIEQNLVGIQGATIDQIKEVYSHPMAISQTRKFFEAYPDIRLIEFHDTAESARMIVKENDVSKAAICSQHAAKLYKLAFLAEGIETHKKNFTRFLIITPDDKEVMKEEQIHKASICFTTLHEVGSLSKVLTLFSFYGLNLTKIQSLPILGEEWRYQFFVDFVFPTLEVYHKAIEAVRPLVAELLLLGEYPEGKLIMDRNTELKYQSNAIV